MNMENIVTLERWEDFNKIISDLQKTSAINAGGSVSPLLFRGQGNSEWGLRTTLEGRRKKPFSFMDYYKLILSIQPETETFSSRNWNIPKSEVLESYSGEYNGINETPPAYEYLVYLRHHGFPSPLLDWSASPYVAAFFAFRDETDVKNDVAIYCYQELNGNGKSGLFKKPKILGLGPKVKSHKRHFLQQSHYTICANFESNKWVYVPHEEVFELGEVDQDKLTKYIIPASERQKVLTDLDMYNINAFSLFDTEETLLEMVSFREPKLRIT